jgi:hypothetical protein
MNVNVNAKFAKCHVANNPWLWKQMPPKNQPHIVTIQIKIKSKKQKQKQKPFDCLK